MTTWQEPSYTCIMLLTKPSDLIKNTRTSSPPALPGRALLRAVDVSAWPSSARPRPFEKNEGRDLEERIADRTEQAESAPWLTSAIVLGSLLVAIVLFALGR